MALLPRGEERERGRGETVCVCAVGRKVEPLASFSSVVFSLLSLGCSGTDGTRAAFVAIIINNPPERCSGNSDSPSYGDQINAKCSKGPNG